MYQVYLTLAYKVKSSDWGLRSHYNKAISRSHREDPQSAFTRKAHKETEGGEQGKDTNLSIFSKSANLSFCSSKPQQKICEFGTFV